VQESLLGLALLLSLPGFAAAQQATYSIEWQSQPQPCNGSMVNGLPGPLLSNLYPICQPSNYQMALSMCRSTFANTQINSEPWATGAAITVIGYQLTMLLSAASAQGVAEIGEAGGNGPDIFAETAGVGTSISKQWWPAGDGISFPPASKNPNSHFDVYTACDGGAAFQVLAHIYYTSP
jgi:hypothetical protein